MSIEPDDSHRRSLVAPCRASADTEVPMFDELQHLAQSPALLRLLAHYVACSSPDRQLWHDRLMRLDDCEGRDLARLHGKLLAYGWLEQNTGTVPGGYRATRGGFKALDEVREAA